MARWQDYVLHDSRANQPLATVVAVGTLYIVSDEDNKIERSDGTDWLSVSPTSYTIGISMDGAGGVLATGVAGYVRVPVSGTITAARLLAAPAGNLVIDVWKDTYANYPPTVADTITASAKPTLSGVAKSEDTTLTGWTTDVTEGDVLGFNVDSAATVTRATLYLEIAR